MRGKKKEHLPDKLCLTCGRPFTWRKKWEKVWAEVRYCSDACRRKLKVKKPGTE
jgi:hypothetical protein